jgi:hypothetical protein
LPHGPRPLTSPTRRHPILPCRPPPPPSPRQRRHRPGPCPAVAGRRSAPGRGPGRGDPGGRAAPRRGDADPGDGAAAVGRPRQALRVVDPLSRAFPQSPPIQLEHGWILAAAGHTQAAVAAFKRALAADPSWPRPGAAWPRPWSCSATRRRPGRPGPADQGRGPRPGADDRRRRPGRRRAGEGREAACAPCWRPGPTSRRRSACWPRRGPAGPRGRGRDPAAGLPEGRPRPSPPPATTWPPCTTAWGAPRPWPAGPAAGRRAAQPRLSEPEGRRPGADRRIRPGHRHLRGRAGPLSPAAQGLDELWPCPEDRRPLGRLRGRLPQGRRPGPVAGRGLVEPGQHEDLPLRRGRPGGDGGAAGREDLERRRPPAPGLRPGQGPRGRRPLRRIVRHYARARRCGGPRSLRPGGDDPARGARQGGADRGAVRVAGRAGLPRARPDLHPGPAARRLDPGRADPGQPLGGRRHHGAARRHRHGPAAGRRQGRETSAIPRSWPR